MNKDEPAIKMFRFHPGYLTIAASLFLIEISIAMYLHDDFVRPYIGDFLVVILLYSFVSGFVNASVKKVGISVLIFAYVIEISQHFKIVRHLGLQHSNIANIIIGNTFEWGDMAAYTLGIAAVMVVEKIRG